MDLDGTQIDTTKSSLNERNIILNNLPAANAEDLISETEEYTLSHPLEFSGPLMVSQEPSLKIVTCGEAVRQNIYGI